MTMLNIYVKGAHHGIAATNYQNGAQLWCITKTLKSEVECNDTETPTRNLHWEN